MTESITVRGLGNLYSEGVTWTCPNCDHEMYGLFEDGQTEHKCDCGQTFILTLSVTVKLKPR